MHYFQFRFQKLIHYAQTSPIRSQFNLAKLFHAEAKGTSEDMTTKLRVTKVNNLECSAPPPPPQISDLEGGSDKKICCAKLQSCYSEINLMFE